MKVFLSVLLFVLVALPFSDALALRNSSLFVDTETDETNMVTVPTNTELYEKYVCVGVVDDMKLLVPGSCSKYYECFNNTATVYSCADPTPYFNSIDAVCAATTSCVEKPIEIDAGPVGCVGVCCGKNAGLYVDPENKANFYFCNNNVGIVHSCCDGEQFNPITKACDVAANCP